MTALTNSAANSLTGEEVERIRRDFPALRQKIHGQPLAYLDNAATTHKPRCVLDALVRFYEEDYANVHRGVHTLSERATHAFEAARDKARQLVNAREAAEMVFVRGTTEAINLVAATWGRRHVGADDEIVITAMEHHSNIVPWQLLCEEKGAHLRVAPINDRGELELDALEALLGPRTRLVSLCLVSNALGSVNPVAEVVERAHARGIPVLVDAAQAVAHEVVDVQQLGCDFLAFSSHKLYGPTGVGLLYGRRDRLETLPPYQGGGDMIRHVTFERSTWNALPYRLEAGTPNIAGAVGLGAAIDYVREIGLPRIEAWEQELLAYGTEALRSVPRLRFIGEARRKAAILSFVIDDIHPHDIGTILDREGVAIRAGHHCAQPLMQRYGVPATARASLAVYNTREDIDQLIRGLHRVCEVLG